ncbi:MAG: hypothetical protein ACOX9E_07450, partial [Lentisphaeria bacterium]
CMFALPIPKFLTPCFSGELFIRRLRRLAQIIFRVAVWCREGLYVCPSYPQICAVFFWGAFYPQITQIGAVIFRVAVWCREGLYVCPSYPQIFDAVFFIRSCETA